jgi:predicted Zn-dependent protease
MKRLLVAAAFAVPSLAGGQPVLEFRGDHAFSPTLVEAVAERAYRTRLNSLAAQGRLDTDPQLLARLRGLVQGLRAAVEYEHSSAAAIHWEIHTCRRCDETAGALAGGRLLVGEEFILQAAFTDDELAYLLAHEMAHVIAEHTRESASYARHIVDNDRNRRFEDIQRELDQNFSVALRMADFHVRQELEADFVGFIVGARSGHDPEAMLGMLRKLHVEGAGAFSSHPSRRERMLRAESMLQMARRLRDIGIPAR